MKCIRCFYGLLLILFLQLVVVGGEEVTNGEKMADNASGRVDLFKNKAVQKEIYYKVVGNKRDPFYAPGPIVVKNDDKALTEAQVVEALTSSLGIVVRGTKSLCFIKGADGKKSAKVFVGASFKLKIGNVEVEVKLVEIKATSSEGVVFQVGEETYMVEK